MNRVKSYLLFCLYSLSLPAIAAESVRILHFAELSGPAKALGQQQQTGLELALEYATDGNLVINDQSLELVSVDIASPGFDYAAELALARVQGTVLAVAPVSSVSSMALIAAAKSQSIPVLLASASHDALVDPASFPHVFRTSPNRQQMVISTALALGDEQVGVCVVSSGDRNARQLADLFSETLNNTGAELVCREDADNGQVPWIDVWSQLTRYSGERILYVYWPVGMPPLDIMIATQPENSGITLAQTGASLAQLRQYQSLPGLYGVGHYYYEFAENELNDWLVYTHFERYQRPPDELTLSGFMAGLAIAEAIKQAPELTPSGLKEVLAGLRFDSPKGDVEIDADSHETRQSLYFFETRPESRLPWAVPLLIREIGVLEQGMATVLSEP